MYTLEIEDSNKLFFTSDTHFGHFNICKYCNRPFTSRSEMDKALIQNWNSVVPEDGIVVHCGDFMLPHNKDIKEYMKYMYHLNGKIVLIRGNHDRASLYWENEKIIKVRDIATIKVNDIKIFAQHYPCLAFNGDFQVFGHIHTLSDGTWSEMKPDIKLLENQYDVGVDQNEYRPISYGELCKKFKI